MRSPAPVMSIPTDAWAGADSRARSAPERPDAFHAARGIFLMLAGMEVGVWEGMAMRRHSAAAAMPRKSSDRKQQGPRSGGRETGLVEAPGIEPGSEDLQCNGSTCVADRFSFAATHAHRLA